jgi:hypothetical protein
MGRGKTHPRHQVFTPSYSLRMHPTSHLPHPTTVIKEAPRMGFFYLATTSITYAVLVLEGRLAFLVMFISLQQADYCCSLVS